MHETKEIRLSSGTIRYREDGPHDGPVLVFVHGFLADGRLWRDVVADASRWARCIAPDLPFGSPAIARDAAAALSMPGAARSSPSSSRRWTSATSRWWATT